MAHTAMPADSPLDANGTTRKRPHLADLIEQLDDRERARRMRRCMSDAGRKRKRPNALALLSAPSCVDR